MASIIRPIWLYKLGYPTWLFPEKEESSLKIGFLALANLGPHETPDIKLQNEDETGRLTRAIPLLLSEHFYLNFTCQSDFIVPYMPETGGYVVTGKEWTDEHLEKLGNNPDNPYAKIITGNFQIDEGSKMIELIVYDIEKSAIISKQEFKAKKNEWPRVYANMLRYLEKEIVTNERVKRINPPSYYVIPTAPEPFEVYLSALSQSLALTMADAGAIKPDGLFGERNMLDYFLNMCVDYPNIELGTLFFISGILKNRECGSDIYREYVDKTRRVVKDTEERELEAQALLPILNLVYGEQFSSANAKRFINEIGDPYTEWLERIEKNEL